LLSVLEARFRRNAALRKIDWPPTHQRPFLGVPGPFYRKRSGTGPTLRPGISLLGLPACLRKADATATATVSSATYTDSDNSRFLEVVIVGSVVAAAAASRRYCRKGGAGRPLSGSSTGYWAHVEVIVTHFDQ
ncbi:hypothetical protein CSPX01_16195, partial [Colletotrichum filicis]